MGNINLTGIDKIYCYKDTYTLKNKLNIKDKEQLKNFERKSSQLAIQEILLKPLQGDLDFKHLKDIHKYIFEDIYDWAGELREVEIGKFGNVFCRVINLESYGNQIFSEIRRQKYFLDLDNQKVMIRLAEIFGDINALHPFREGNGRTQRVFLNYLAYTSGYKLTFDSTTALNNINASKLSMSKDYEQIIKLINKIASPITKEQQRSFIQNMSTKILKLFDELDQKGCIVDRTGI